MKLLGLFLISLIVATWSIGLASATTYSECSIYGNCKTKTGTTINNGSTIYQNNTYINQTADMTNVAFTNRSENWTTKNVSASWFFGYINWSYIQNAPLFSWLFPDTTNGYLYNDTSKIYFNESKLNNTISQLAPPSNLTGYAMLNGSNQPFTGNISILAGNKFTIKDNNVLISGLVGESILVNATLPTLQGMKSPAIVRGYNGSYSVSFWIYPYSVDQPYSRVMHEVDNKYPSEYSNNYLYHESNLLQWIGVDTSSTTRTITSSVNWAHDAWNHIVMISNGTNRFLYLNGVLTGTDGPYPMLSGRYCYPANDPADYCNVYWNLGNIDLGYGVTERFDEFAYWINRSLSQSDVNDLYNSGNGKYITTGDYGTNLSLLYHIDSSTGYLIDGSGNSRTATLINGTYLNGKISSADSYVNYSYEVISSKSNGNITIGNGTNTNFLGYLNWSWIQSIPTFLSIINQNLNTTSTPIFSGINTTGDITPSTTATYSLGSSILRWLKGWFTNLDVSGTINSGANYSIGGINGTTKGMTILKDVDLVGLTKTYCDLNFSGGILISSTC